MRDRRAQRAHRERYDIHRTAGHAAVEQAVQGLAHLVRVGPVIGRTRLLFRGRADEGTVFDTRHVARVGAGQVRVRALLRVQALHRARFDHLCAQAVVLFFGAVAPVDGVGLREGRDLGHPIDEFIVLDVSWDVQCGDAAHHGLVHTYLQCQLRIPGDSDGAGSAEAAACNARGFRNPVNLVPAGSSSRMASWARTGNPCGSRFSATAVMSPARGSRVRGAGGWLERVLLAANDVNLTSQALISGRFYTCTNSF